MEEARQQAGIDPYLQNRELSWLTFNERVLDQGSDEHVPLLERLKFVSIFQSNLYEFFMVRVGSLTDLSLVKKHIVDSKSGMTPTEQLEAIHARCAELYPLYERTYETVRSKLAEHGIGNVKPAELAPDERSYLNAYTKKNIIPFLSPQIINSRHPFPHLESGALYVVVRLDEKAAEDAALGMSANDDGGEKPDKTEKTEAGDGKARKATKEAKDGKRGKNMGAKGVTMGLIPLPRQCERLIMLPGENVRFVLLEHAIEAVAAEVFSMYKVKHTNVIRVTRNADLDVVEGADEADDDYREHMKRILKKRARLAPVRLESEKPLSATLRKLLLKRLGLKTHQAYATAVPLDLGYAFSLEGRLPEKKRAKLAYAPFSPQWPASLDRTRRIIDQVQEREVLLSYPYESMDAFVQLLREAAADPDVVSIKITLYRLAAQSHLAEALINAAENGKEVTALFELRARFDESNNIVWSQRFEEAGCTVIYGFRDCKVHSKICCITRRTEDGLQHITQLGTGNYNEKTAKLYTDLSFITCDETFGRDATEFFRNMALENTSADYEILWVAPLQIKPMILAGIEREMERAQVGEEAELVFKTNSITDKDVIDKLAEASQAGVKITLIVRGISCIVPGAAGFTDNVRVVSIVGRLLEHSRIYGFGPRGRARLYLSSADLMTRNMDKRIEIAWPVLNDQLRGRIIEYLDTCLKDTAKLRELRPDGTYTLPPASAGAAAAADATATADTAENVDGNASAAAPIAAFDSQEFLIKQAQRRLQEAAAETAARNANRPSAAEAHRAWEAVENAAARASTAGQIIVVSPTAQGRARTSRNPLKRLLAKLHGRG